MRHHNKNKQQGIAALLGVIFLGLGMLAIVLTIVYNSRNVQDATLTTHKVTQAQVRAWKGVEVVRLGLQGMPTATLASLAPGDLAITGLSDITATVLSNTAYGGGRRVNVRIKGSGATNTATSTVNIVYMVMPSTSGSSTMSSTNAVNIKGKLTSTGWLKFYPATSGTTTNVVSVDGAVDLSGTILNFDRLCATGDVTVGSDITINTVCSDSNLTVNGSAAITTALIKGNVVHNGSAKITNITSNGNVTISAASGSADLVGAKGSVTIGNNATVGDIETESNVIWTSANASTSNIKANGYITYTGNSPSTMLRAGTHVTLTSNGNVKDVTAGGNVGITSNWSLGVKGALKAGGTFTWGSNIGVQSGVVGGAISPALPAPAWAPAINVVRTAGYMPTIPTITIPTISNTFTPVMTVDVYPLEASANYVFKIDANGKRTVQVRNVNGITDGTYFLGNYSINGTKYMEYLCTAVDSSNNCTAPSTPYKTICYGYSLQNGCFTYASGTQTWTVGGTTIAPGVAYFEGNLVVSNGIYFNTWLATGDLATSGQTTSYAVNFAEYAGVCTNANDKGRNTHAVHAGIYPKAFCNLTTGVMTPQPIGNPVYIAGGYKNGVFSGGTITLTNGNEQYGSVLAGSRLTVTGNTTVHGQVVSAGQGSNTNSSTGGGVTVDMRNLPSTADPGTTPCMGTTCGSGGGAVASIIWSAYE